MKIFFSISFRGDQTVGKKIYHEIEILGHTHASTCIIDNIADEFYSWNEGRRADHTRRVFSEISQADIVVVEASLHSLTIGQFIQQALAQKIPVLILCRKGISLAFQDGFAHEQGHLLVSEYTDENLSRVLKEGINYLSESNNGRFTMIFPSDIIKHLDDISSTKNISRSEYIRNLIRTDMKKQSSD